jgi:SAM-dependent methyltransferase
VRMKSELARAYDGVFFENQGPGSRESASVVVPLAQGLVHPESVLDVGCGVGTWVAEWASRGVTDVLGIDGEYVEKSALQVPTANFQSVDLRKPFSIGRRFDLVQSLEVAEHLDESCADTFVQSLVSHADNILFSAAIPGQGGVHHVNEQWLTYWVEKFSRFELKHFDVIRPAIWMDRRVKRWYRQNILLFSRNLTFNTQRTPIDVVQPEYWNELRAHPPLSRMPASVAYAIRDKLPTLGK